MGKLGEEEQIMCPEKEKGDNGNLTQVSSTRTGGLFSVFCLYWTREMSDKVSDTPV